jgi:glucose-6-phosphate 1-dehydrogenase
MESPEKLSGEHIRAQRAKVLEHVRMVDAVLGQYEGYTHEPRVHQQSTTETFAAVQCMVDNHRWAGVPFYLKTGKCLQKKESLIHIQFKHVDCLLIQNCPSESNGLTIRIAPNPSFFLTLNAKKPGALHEVMPVHMEFVHHQLDHGQAHAYEVIVQEVIRGEHSIAVRFDEIESAWKIIDAIAHQKRIYTYRKGSSGPQEAELFAHNHGIRWRA